MATAKKKAPAKKAAPKKGDEPVRVGRAAKQKLSEPFSVNPERYKKTQQRAVERLGFDRSAGPNRNPKPLWKMGRAFQGTNIPGFKSVFSQNPSDLASERTKQRGVTQDKNKQRASAKKVAKGKK